MNHKTHKKAQLVFVVNRLEKKTVISSNRVTRNGLPTHSAVESCRLSESTSKVSINCSFMSLSVPIS